MAAGSGPPSARQLGDDPERAVAAVHRLRGLDLAKPPGVAETLDWVEALRAIGASDLDARIAADTLGAVVKDRDDLDVVNRRLDDIVRVD